MHRKNIVRRHEGMGIFIVAIALLSSCASPGQREQRGQKSGDTSQLPENLRAGEGPLLGEGDGLAELEVKDINGAVEVSDYPQESARSSQPLRADAVGIWIHGVAYDAFAALGFLQEFERRGLAPAKVMGSGFGCWVAWAWALENNGNRAEWQSFKWEHWEHLRSSGVLGRLGMQNLRDRFENEVQRHWPQNLTRAAKVPADCPLLGSRPPYELRSSLQMDFPSVMWQQLQIPSLVDSTSSSDRQTLSGVFASVPRPEDIDRFSGGGIRRWIVLRTYQPTWIFAKDSPEAQAFASRSDVLSQRNGRSRAGRPWQFEDLSRGVPGGRQQPNALLEGAQRRAWLLHGRRAAARFLEIEENRKFLQGSR